MGKERHRQTVNYKVRFLGEDQVDLRHNGVYDCIAECFCDGKLEDIAVVDLSGEDYMYNPKHFEKVEDSQER